jgi:hypothetical protein
VRHTFVSVGLNHQPFSLAACLCTHLLSERLDILSVIYMLPTLNSRMLQGHLFLFRAIWPTLILSYNSGKIMEPPYSCGYILFCMNVVKLESIRTLIRVQNYLKIMSIWRPLYFDITIIIELWFFLLWKFPRNKQVRWSYFHVKCKTRTLQTYEICIFSSV